MSIEKQQEFYYGLQIRTYQVTDTSCLQFRFQKWKHLLLFLLFRFKFFITIEN